jgi:hypothetical protein
MKNPMEQMNEIEDVIRQLHKLEAKLMNGQFIMAYRDNRRLISKFENIKHDLIESTKEELENSDDIES